MAITILKEIDKLIFIILFVENYKLMNLSCLIRIEESLQTFIIFH